MACCFFSCTMALGQGPGSLAKGALPAAPVLARTTLPAPWNYTELGLFCKLDVQLERRTRMPILFRLGDVQQVEAWEGKGPLRLAPLR